MYFSLRENMICSVRARDGYREPVFFGPVRNWVNTGLPVSFGTNDTVIDTCVVYLRILQC